MEKKQYGGVHKRPNGTYSVTPRMPLGKLGVDDLETILEVMRKFNLRGIQATTGQRISIEGVPADVLDEVVELLNGVGNDTPQSIMACRGASECKHGLQDTHEMAEAVENLFRDTLQMSKHLKVGLSGCERCCGNSYIRDIGLVGTTDGWTLAVGGRSGNRVRSGDDLLVDASREQIMTALTSFLTYYRENALEKERISSFIERVGIDHIKSKCLSLVG